MAAAQRTANDSIIPLSAHGVPLPVVDLSTKKGRDSAHAPKASPSGAAAPFAYDQLVPAATAQRTIHAPHPDPARGLHPVTAMAVNECHRAKVILTHEPGSETRHAMLAASAGLFEQPFSPDVAATQHAAYRALLARDGAKVITVRDVLLWGCADEHGRPIEGPALDNLRALALASATLSTEGLSAAEATKHQAGMAQAIARFQPRELVKVILERPTTHLMPSPLNTGVEASYGTEPLMNMYFMRDQMITTARGVVPTCMNSNQRAHEVAVAEFVSRKLGIVPLYTIPRVGEGGAHLAPCAFDEDTRPARLEGGDFIPAGHERCFIGRGLRTSADAIEQLLDNDVFGTERVVVVNDAWWNQEQMHLDTFFNIAAHKKAVLVETRMPPAPGSARADHMTLTCDVWLRGADGKYTRERKDLDFCTYLTQELGYTLIGVPADDQLRYGCNFLTVADGVVFGVDGVSQAYKDRMAAAGIDVTWVPMDELTRGYGAAHCMTQVLRRSNSPMPPHELA